MKKIFYNFIFLIFLMTISPLIVFSAENINSINTVNEAINKSVIQDEQKTINNIQKNLEKDATYPIIEAFKTSNEKEDENKSSIEEDIVMKGGVEIHGLLSLDDAIKLALANNPSIMSAISNTEIYKSKIGQAWSGYFPKFSAGIGYDRTKSLMPMISNAGSLPAYNYFKTINLTAEQTIFDFGKHKANVNMAKKNYGASQDNLQATINDVIYSVKEAYYALLYAIQKEGVFEDTVARYEIHLKQSNAYYNIGVKPKLDVLTAEYNLSNAKLGLIKAKNDIDIAIAALNNAMGLPEQANYSIEEKIKLKKYEYNFDNLLNNAYDVRPELLAAQKKSEASAILVKASIRAFAPDLKIAASYNLGGITPSKDYGYAFGGNFSYPVTNLMLLKKEVDEAKATAKKDDADFQKAKQDVYLAVKNAYLTLYETEQTIPVTKNAMRQAQEQYELASGRYKVGIGEIIELKDAENTYRNSQLDYYSAILNYNIAIANLEKVVGIPMEQIAKILESSDL